MSPKNLQAEALPIPIVTKVIVIHPQHRIAHMRAHARAWSSPSLPMPGDMVTACICTGRWPRIRHQAAGDGEGGVTR
jgi:hypothetical protein